MGPIEQGSCPRPLNNCVEFTITGSFTFVGALTGPPVGFNPILVFDVANAQNRPAGARSQPCSTVNAPGVTNCAGVVPDPGLFPQLGGTVRVPAVPPTVTPTPTPTPTATPLIILQPPPLLPPPLLIPPPPPPLPLLPPAPMAPPAQMGPPPSAAPSVPVIPEAPGLVLLLGGLGLLGGMGAWRRGRGTATRGTSNVECAVLA